MHEYKTPDGKSFHNHDLVVRSQKISSTVRDIAFERLDPDTNRVIEDVTSLFSLLEAANNPEELRRKNIGTAIRHYNHPMHSDVYNQKDREYFSAIVSDFVVLNTFLDDEHTAYREGHPTDKFRTELEQSRHCYPVIDLNRIAKLLSEEESKFPNCKGVNIESVLIKSSATFVSLREEYERENPDLQALSKLVYNVEAFYAPVCEIIGYDALAMALRDYTSRIRVLQSDPITVQEPTGEIVTLTGADRLERAAAQLDELGDVKAVEALVTRAIDQLFGDSISISSIQNESEHGIKFGAGTVEFEGSTNTTRDVEFRWRVKSLGSLAKKYNKYASPMDIIGITLITGSNPENNQSEEESQRKAEFDIGELFGRMITQSASLDNFFPAPTAERKFPFITEGSDEYTEIMTQAAGDQDIHLYPPENGFQVAKGTVIFNDDTGLAVPMEIQIQTLRDRRVARIGEASHPIYKTVGKGASVPEELLQALIHIAQRKETVNAGPTRQSLKRGIKNINRIDSTPPPPHIGSRAVKMLVDSVVV